MEYLATLIDEYASFLGTYGNWVLIPLLIGVIVIDNTLLKSVQSTAIRRLSKSLLVITVFALGGLIYTINFPLKPMVRSISKVQTSVGQKIYDFDFIDVRKDRIYAISDLQGTPIILNFWGTYCRPCIEEFPDLKKIESVYSNEVRVIALSDEDKDRIMRFIERIESPAIVGSFSSEKWIELESFRPLTIIIDKEGIVKEYVFGKKDFNYFESAIADLL